MILKAGEQQDTALKFYLGDCMPTDLISDDKWAKPELGSRWFLPSDDREECEPGPNSVMEVDMRQFVSAYVMFIFMQRFDFFSFLL